MTPSAFDTYQQEALRTDGCKDHTIERRVSMAALGLTGEAGEVADIIKKVLYHSHPIDRDKLRKELGDVLYYIASMASALKLDLSEIALVNIEKLKARYPNGFDPEKSLYRSPSDV